MDSFDHSLKYLLQHDPAAFLRFGLDDPSIEILASIPSDLPSRGRDIDGSYLIVRHGERLVAHLEFHRRHQRQDDLAIDVAEAQIRLFRRERLPVLSLVWDLYGSPDQPLVSQRALPFGPTFDGLCSCSFYQRINLRALGFRDLLTSAPSALWPLVTLTRDGIDVSVVRQTLELIQAQPALSPSQVADHLAILWFVAEAEGLPIRLLHVYLTEEKLMESELYKSIFSKGEAKGEARGEAKTKADAIVRVLMRRLGSLEPSLRERIRSTTDIETITNWYELALDAVDTPSAERLVDLIRRASIA